jgi:hypothetical protein
MSSAGIVGFEIFFNSQALGDRGLGKAKACLAAATAFDINLQPTRSGYRPLRSRD